MAKPKKTLQFNLEKLKVLTAAETDKAQVVGGRCESNDCLPHSS